MINWINADKQKPNHSSAVLITDGKDISVAHWFNSMFNPRTNETLPGDWVNQHERLTGGYIENPTYWAEIVDLLTTIPK